MLSTTSSRRSVSNTVNAALRSSQAAESFRESFAKSAGAAAVITSSDLDYHVVETKSRPSVFIDVFTGLGFALGTASRVMPNVASKLLLSSVDEACRRSINDDLRDVGDADMEVKDTLKYHRDICLSEESVGDGSSVESKVSNAITIAIHGAIRLSNKI